MARRSAHVNELIDIAELKAQSGEASFANGTKLASQGAVQQPRALATEYKFKCHMITLDPL